MRLLTRHVLGGFDRFSLLRCRRSIHLVPDSPATVNANNPRWVLLNCYDVRRDTSMVADATTAAEARTSTGKPLRVSFTLAPPPASSYLCYDCAGTAPDDINVIAAHGDSVLFMMQRKGYKYDHFVYRAGDAARPPSLSLLPARDVPTKYEDGTAYRPYKDPGRRVLLSDDTGILRRSEDELLVAQLEVRVIYSETDKRDPVADLCMLRLGRRNWDLKRSVPIVHDGGEGGESALRCHGAEKVITVGDRFLCWVDSYWGILVCDMAEEDARLKLRYVPMPALPQQHDRRLYSNDQLPLQYSKDIGVAGTDALRFVRVDSRCCCGGPGRSSCARTRFAFTVTTWTLTLRMNEPMRWVKDGVLDCEELWALPGYKDLPRVHLKWPVVSLDNPDIVSFIVSDGYPVKHEDRKSWMIQVDTRRKGLMSVVQCTNDDVWKERFRLPARLQQL